MSNPLLDNRQLGPDTARANLLTNGGFEIWQRGNGPFTGSSVFNADRWVSSLNASDTLSVSKDTTNMDTSLGSRACAACTFVLSGGNGTTMLMQYMPMTDGNQLVNRTLSYSIRVRTSTANAVRAVLYNGSAQVYGSFHTGDGTYQTLTVTSTVASAATFIQIQVFFAASCTAYLDNAMLVVGSQPATYAPLHPADDLARCLRYYETWQPGVGQLMATGQAYTTTSVAFPLSCAVKKAVTPTITVSAPTDIAATNAAGTAVIGGSVTAPDSRPDGFRISLTVQTASLVAGNASLLVGQTANARINAESNP